MLVRLKIYMYVFIAWYFVKQRNKFTFTFTDHYMPLDYKCQLLVANFRSHIFLAIA